MKYLQANTWREPQRGGPGTRRHATVPVLSPEASGEASQMILGL